MHTAHDVFFPQILVVCGEVEIQDKDKDKDKNMMPNPG